MTIDDQNERSGDGGEAPLLAIEVECYAGYRGEQTPRVLVLDGRRVEVAAVLDAWLAPDHRYFKLQDPRRDTYIVRHDARTGVWEMTFYRRVANGKDGNEPDG